MKAIIVKNTGGTYVATVHGASKFKASCTMGELQAAAACVTKWYGQGKEESLRRVNEREELLELFDVAHLPIITGPDKYVFFFNDRAKSGEIITVETEVLAPAPKQEISACNALHTLVSGRADEARRAAESACHFAVILGLKLALVKRETPHGQWNTLFLNSRLAKAKGEQNQNVLIFKFSEQTASNYMRAAEGAMNRPGLPSAAKKLIEQVAAHEEVIETLTEAETSALDKATRGETLRQLYIDLGVMRAPATAKTGMGGNKPSKVKATSTEDDLWEGLVDYFAPITKIVETGELTQLSPPRLAELETLLRGYLDEVKKISKK